MSYREIPANWLLEIAISIGTSMGLKKDVTVSDHTINIQLTDPDKDNKAWDHYHFKHGNLFVRGYANPIKPQIEHHAELENPDTVTIEEPDTETDGGETDDGKHVSLISSSRYRDYMRQDLVSQLLTPQEQWKLIAYGVIGLAILQFFTMILVLYATGSF